MAETSSDTDTRAEFDRAYQQKVDAWPVPVESRDVSTDYGTTHLLVSGPESAPTVVLLPGGGSTATAWSSFAAKLSHGHQTVAVDPIGQPGLSRAVGKPLQRVEDLTDWLDQLLGALAVDQVTLVGHSCGAWMALRYALHAGDRVSCLVLVDPTDCFTALSLSYRLRAVPLFLRPSGRRMRRFLAWETRGRPLDPAWLRVVAFGAELGRSSIVMPAAPPADELASVTVPTLVAVAARSRAQDPARIARRAGELMPAVSVVEIAGATHHTLPTEDSQDLADAVNEFIAKHEGELP